MDGVEGGDISMGVDGVDILLGVVGVLGLGSVSWVRCVGQSFASVGILWVESVGWKHLDFPFQLEMEC